MVLQYGTDLLLSITCRELAYKRDRFSVALYATEERSLEDEKLYAGQNRGGEKKNNEVNWMVSNSAKLDRRTKQHTQFGVSTSNGSRDMARTKSWRKKKIEKKITKRIGW